MKLLTAEEVAELLGCTAVTASQALVAGDLPGVKYGVGWRVPESALHQALHKQAMREAADRRKARADEQGGGSNVTPIPRTRRKPIPRLPPRAA
jgi:excisionase family DNA binding protein